MEIALVRILTEILHGFINHLVVRHTLLASGDEKPFSLDSSGGGFGCFT